MTFRPWKNLARLAGIPSGVVAFSLASLVGVAPALCFGDVATKILAIDVATEVGGLDFSPNGKFLAIDSHGNGGTDIWDFTRKRMIAHVKDGGVYVWVTDVVHFSPDGRQLAICSNRLSIYDTATWEPIPLESTSAHGATSDRPCGDGLVFSPDGKALVAISNNFLLFYDTSTWDVTKKIRTVKFPKVDLIADSTTVDLRDPNDPDFTFISQGGSLSFSNDGRYLALGGYSFSKKPWRPGEGEMPPSIPKTIVVDLSTNLLAKDLIGGVAALDRSPDGANIAVGAIDAVYTVKILNAASGVVVASEKGGPSQVLLRYTPDGRYLIESIDKDKTVEIWDGQHAHLLQSIRAEPSSIAVSRDSHYFALGGSPNSILDATALLSLITHPNGPAGKVIVYRLK
jgi:WD40 repeat protein